MSLAKTCGERSDVCTLHFRPPAIPGSGLFGSRVAQDHTGVGIASDARVLCRRGLVPAGELAVGDCVSDGQGGWTVLAAAVRISTDIGVSRIRIAQGAFGGGLPSFDLEVGPSTRLRLCSDLAKRLVGKDTVLIAAKDLVGQPGVTRVSGTPGDITHLVFEHHGYVLAEDVVVQAFVPDAEVLESMPAPHQEQILSALPKLRYEGARAAYAADAPMLNAREARQILAAPSTFGANLGLVSGPRADSVAPRAQEGASPFDGGHDLGVLQHSADRPVAG